MIRVTVEHIEENHEDEPTTITVMDIVSDGTGTMENGTTYYWGIDEVNKWGKAIGQIWSFTTIGGPVPPPPPPPP